MRQTLIVSNRGQLTLPVNLRKRFVMELGAARHFSLFTSDLNHFGPFIKQPDMAFSILVQTVAEFLTALIQGTQQP
jgi:hypothetical protein